MDEFDSWNAIKKDLEHKSREFLPRAGEVWVSNLGKNIGFESNGKNTDFIRSVLVLKSYGKSGAIIVPLTSKKQNNMFHLQVNERSYAKLTQVKFIDLKRFKRKLFKIDRILLLEIRKKLFEVI